MKKKVLYGVALTLMASVAMGTLQSCKDDLNDVVTQTKYDRDQLQKQLNQLRDDLSNYCLKTDCENRLNQAIADLKALLEGEIADKADKTWVQGEITRLEGLITTATSDKVTEDQMAAAIQAAIDALEIPEAYNDQWIHDALAEVAGRLDAFDAFKDETTVTLGNLQDQLAGLALNITDLQDKSAEHEIAIYNLGTRLDDQQRVIDALQQTLSDLQTSVQNNKEEIQKLVDHVVDLQKQIDKILDEFDLVYSEIQGVRDYVEQLQRLNNERFEALEKAVDKLTERMDKLVTGILVQGTDSPVFGTFNLPIGVQSNLLFNWYGYYKNEQNPAFGKGTAQEWFDMDQDGFSGKVALGDLYLTINPIGHDFTGLKLSLVTSTNNVFPVTLTTEDPGDYEIKFGYSRAVEGNGFYKVPVALESSEDADAVRLKLDNNLEDAIKELVKDPNRRTPVNLLKAIYEQLNDKVPAYAVRCDWKMDDQINEETGEVIPGEEYAVISKYEVAATTAKALSYNFLKGQGSGKRLPIIGSFQNLVLKLKENGNLHFNFETISFANINVTIPEITIRPSAPNPGLNIVAVIPGYDVKDENGNVIGHVEDQEVVFENMADVNSTLQSTIQSSIESITSQLSTWNTTASQELSTNLQEQLDPIAKQLNDMMGTINGKIDSLIDQVANSSYASLVNKAFDIYNKVAGKINNFLADPNHYLQVAAFYEMNGGVGILSEVPTDPTVFTGNGEAINVFLSSYTGELVVPAFKKYVACTKVFDADKKEIVGADLDVINKGKRLDEVIEGSNLSVSIPVANLESGNTYEFTYQGLDYSGYVSEKKFYITVNKF